MRNIIYVLSLFFGACFLVSCETWRDICTGEIVIENPIPDTTLYIGGEPFRRDVFADPVVLRHTDNRIISILVLADDPTIVQAGRKINSETQRASVIEAIPKKAGETIVTITAGDDCETIQISFNVAVIDTVNS